MLRRRRHNTPVLVAVTPATPGITDPDTEQFAAEVTNIHGADISAAATGTWSSSDLDVATIDADGLATSVGAGTSDINFATDRLGVVDATPAVLTVS